MPRSVKAKVRTPEPLPWNERSPVLNSLKGDRNLVMDDLASLLQLIGDGRSMSDVIAWPDPGSELTVTTAIAPINRSGLFARAGQTVRLSDHGRRWLENRDPEYLITVFHAHTRFVGEILNELNSESMSQQKLLSVAQERYGFAWTTSGPVFNRVRWLQAAGLVNTFSHKVHITAKGRAFLAQLSVYEPDTAVNSSADLRPAPQAIEDVLAKIDKDQKRRSRAATLSIPGIKTGRGRLDAIRLLIEACTSPMPDQALIDETAATFSTGRAAADRGVLSLRFLGLLEKVSPTETAVTPAAVAWMTTGYNIDLARIIHANIWYFGEIIGELETAGRLTFGQLVDVSARYSMGGHYARLGRNALTSRMALLEALGLIAHVSNKLYRATPLGSAFRQSVPNIAPADARSSASSSDKDREGEKDDQQFRETHSYYEPASRIADCLERAARRSEKSVELEQAAIDALDFLGLPSTHIGGNGEPDGIVRTKPGRLGAKLTVETKSAANGAVPEEQAKPATLTYHREQHDAESTVYIGPGFENRLLDVLDNDPNVAVVSTALIAEAVRRQVDTPLTPDELRPLFDPSVCAADRRPLLLERWKEKEDFALCMRAIVEVLSREAQSPMSDEEFESFGVGWLNIASIRRSLRDLLNREVTKEIIGEALEFLASPQVAIVERADERYRLRVSRNVIAHHFAYLARRWTVGDRCFDRSRASSQRGNRSTYAHNDQ